MKKFILLLAGGALAMLALPSYAQPVTNTLSPWYFSFSGGVVYLEDADIGAADDPALDAALRAVDFQVTSDLGFSGSAALGYEFGAVVRVEGELGFRSVDLDKATSNLGQVSLVGDAQAASLMLNAVHDFRIGNSPFVPYVGGGVGIAYHDIELSGISDDDTTLAYQGMFGVSYEVPQQTLGFFVQYRYFATGDPDFGGITSEFRTHAVEFGIRANF